MTVSLAPLPAPAPGTDLVPDDWWASTVRPWADEQTDGAALQAARAKVAGLEEAYRQLDADTLELVKSLRYLELRWGQLLGPGEDVKTGPGRNASHASEPLDKDQRHRFRLLADNEERVIECIAAATDSSDLSRAVLLRTVTGAHVGNNFGDNEWNTPAPFIAAARAAMGGIDLDPASSSLANELVVGAPVFFTARDDGLAQPWSGRVWLNPPYATPVIGRFSAKLTETYESGEVTQACVLTNNATDTGWWHTLDKHAAPVCFPLGRVKFWHPERDEPAAPLQGQTVMYFGARVAEFRAVFERFGRVR